MAEMMSDLQSLQGVLLGLGLRELPKVMQALHQAQNAGRNVKEGRAPKDDGQPATPQAGSPQGYDVQSVLAPLLAQMGGGSRGGGGQPPMPANSPGMRPGLPPAPLPQMPGLPRTMQAGASPAGF